MKKPIEQHFILAFEGNLKRKPLDEHEEVQFLLEDFGGMAFEDEPIRMADLPRAIPEVIRKRMVEKSREAYAALKELGDYFEQLQTVSGKLMNQRIDEEEQAKPHCETCGQVVAPKKNRRK